MIKYNLRQSVYLTFDLPCLVTHVVTPVNKNGHCPRTMKYFSGILTGKWIVSFNCKYLVLL